MTAGFDPRVRPARAACAICLIMAAFVALILSASHGRSESGLASFYWHGQQTASGERFNPGAMTAAHRTRPFGQRVRVTNLSNGRAVVVRINDRGPFIRGRVIDLSRGAASAIGMIGAGVARVRISVP